MTITINVESPEEAARIMAVAKGAETPIQETPKGKMGFARKEQPVAVLPDPDGPNIGSMMNELDE